MAEQRPLLTPSSMLQSPSRASLELRLYEYIDRPAAERPSARSCGLADAAYREEVLRVMLSCQEHTSRIRQTEVAT